MFTIAERVDNISFDVIEPLVGVGLRQVFLGLESGNQAILDKFKKGITLSQTEKAIQVLRALHVDIEVSFITFTPECTIDQIEGNLNYFISLKVNILQGLLNRLQCYGGTDIFNDMHQAGNLKGSFPFYSFQNVVDERVDFLYNLVRESLGVFLPVSYEIKKVRKKLRNYEFSIKQRRDAELLPVIALLSKEFNALVVTIMEEAAEIYRALINFTRNNYKSSNDVIKNFTLQFTNETRIQAQNWFNMIIIYARYRLHLEMNKGGYSL